MTAQDWRRSWGPWLRGTGLGFPFGALPAGGAEIPTFLSYTYEKHRSKHKDEFGKGAIEGVAGPEAANNASFSGVLVPLLTLGIPTSATAAVLLAAFQIFNLQPGPQLFEKSPELVWALIASLYVGNVLLLALNLPLIRIWVKVLQIPRPMLYAGILVFATLGVYAVSGNITEVLIAYAIGVVGFLLRQYGFPIAPVILGVILGPMMEEQFRRSLLISDGDFTVFLTRPLTLILLLLSVGPDHRGPVPVRVREQEQLVGEQHAPQSGTSGQAVRGACVGGRVGGVQRGVQAARIVGRFGCGPPRGRHGSRRTSCARRGRRHAGRDRVEHSRAVRRQAEVGAHPARGGTVGVPVEQLLGGARGFTNSEVSSGGN